VKRILVPQRENPIVNRLNKTKVEKFPDLAMEKEDILKALRKKDQAAKLERVSLFHWPSFMARLNTPHRRKKRPGLLKSGRRRSGRRITHMMSFSRKRILMKQITRIGERTS
jgi:hypothetical protein